MQNEIWSIKKILDWSAKYLAEKKSETPRLDAELLLSNVLGLSRISLYTNFEKPLSEIEREHYRKKLHRRSLGEPIAYILNSKEFYGLDFNVNPSVLIPRPDTEILVEAVIEYLKHDLNISRIMDLGTGSGCIPISLAKKFPEIQLEAWDLYAEALEVAQGNAMKHQVNTQIKFLQKNILDHQSWANFTDKVDIIISNPPYIAHDEKASLNVSVKNYEPDTALFADNNGLLFYEKISYFAPSVLKQGGKIFLEIGYQQAGAVCGILERDLWKEIFVKKDYQGLDRVVIATL